MGLWTTDFVETVFKTGIFKQAATWFADLTGRTKCVQLAGVRSDSPGETEAVFKC